MSPYTTLFVSKQAACSLIMKTLIGIAASPISDTQTRLLGQLLDVILEPRLYNAIVEGVESLPDDDVLL